MNRTGYLLSPNRPGKAGGGESAAGAAAAQATSERQAADHVVMAPRQG